MSLPSYSPNVGYRTCLSLENCWVKNFRCFHFKNACVLLVQIFYHFFLFFFFFFLFNEFCKIFVISSASFFPRFLLGLHLLMVFLNCTYDFLKAIENGSQGKKIEQNFSFFKSYGMGNTVYKISNFVQIFLYLCFCIINSTIKY